MRAYPLPSFARSAVAADVAAFVLEFVRVAAAVDVVHE